MGGVYDGRNFIAGIGSYNTLCTCLAGGGAQRQPFYWPMAWPNIVCVLMLLAVFS